MVILIRAPGISPRVYHAPAFAGLPGRRATAILMAMDSEEESGRGGWRFWARRLGRVQVNTLLGALYFLAFLPAAPIYRRLLDPLRRRSGGGGRWLERPPEDPAPSGRRQS